MDVTFVFEPGVVKDEGGPTITIYHPEIIVGTEKELPNRSLDNENETSQILKELLQNVCLVPAAHVNYIEPHAIKALAQLLAPKPMK